jgi:hypothetical protein
MSLHFGARMGTLDRFMAHLTAKRLLRFLERLWSMSDGTRGVSVLVDRPEHAVLVLIIHIFKSHIR